MNQPRQSSQQLASNTGEVLLSAVLPLNQLVGQAAFIKRLTTFGELYRNVAKAPEHVLLTGNEGNGRQTLLRAFAKSYNVALREFDAEQFKRKADLTAVLTALDIGEALLITNLHTLRKPIREVLIVAMQYYRVDLIIGVTGRIHPFPLGRFTLLATAPRIADVHAELAGCFALTLNLDPYSDKELVNFTSLRALQLGLTLSPEATGLIAMSSQRTPNSIDQLLRKFIGLGKSTITEVEARNVLAAFGLGSGAVDASIGATSMDELSGVEFEKVTASLLQRMGFRAETTQATGDGGIDIVAHLNKPIVGGRYLIQCKRFGSLVGAPIVREFYGAVVADRKATKGILITTSGFTDQAREFARGLPIELIDRNQLEKLLSENRLDEDSTSP